MIGLTMRNVTWNRFPIKNLWLIPCFFHLWSEATWIQICASLNHRKKMKAEPSRLIPLKPIGNAELFIVSDLIRDFSDDSCLYRCITAYCVVDKCRAWNSMEKYMFWQIVQARVRSHNSACHSGSSKIDDEKTLSVSEGSRVSTFRTHGFWDVQNPFATLGLFKQFSSNERKIGKTVTHLRHGFKFFKLQREIHNYISGTWSVVRIFSAPKEQLNNPSILAWTQYRLMKWTCKF